MKEPIIISSKQSQGETHSPISAMEDPSIFMSGAEAGPIIVHVHYSDDEAWHILEGTLAFKVSDRVEEVPAGTTVFVPAGVPHAYYEAHGPVRYLIILTPRLRELIAALHAAPFKEHNEINAQVQFGDY